MKRPKTIDKPLRKFPGRLVLLGAGKMGLAMLDGWLARGLDPRKLTILGAAARQGRKGADTSWRGA